MSQPNRVPVGQAELEIAMLIAMSKSAKPENAAALESQIPVCAVVDREYSPVGSFTKYRVDGRVVEFPRADFDGVGHIVFGDFGLMSGARFPSGTVATFHVCVKGGRLTLLEGMTLEGEPWPDDVSTFEVV